MPNTLPQEIWAAIDVALGAASTYGRVFDLESARNEEAARASLAATILRHLRDDDEVVQEDDGA